MTEAVRELELAVHLSPNQPAVLVAHTSFHLLPHGLVRQAIAQYERCLELDPLSAPHHSGAAMVLTMDGQ